MSSRSDHFPFGTRQKCGSCLGIWAVVPGTMSAAGLPGDIYPVSGLDLAWRESRAGIPANETGVAVIDSDGQVLNVGWVRGADESIAWAQRAAGDGDALMFVDAPLVVRDSVGQRLCETQVGQRYGKWKVSANGTSLQSPSAEVRVRYGSDEDFLESVPTSVCLQSATSHWGSRFEVCDCGLSPLAPRSLQ